MPKSAWVHQSEKRNTETIVRKKDGYKERGGSGGEAIVSGQHP